MVVNADCTSWSIFVHRFYLVKIVWRKSSPLCFFSFFSYNFNGLIDSVCTIIQLNGREELRICIVFGKCKNYFYCKHILHQSFIHILQFPYLGGGLPLTFQGFIDYDMTIQNSEWMFPCICHRHFPCRIL